MEGHLTEAIRRLEQALEALGDRADAELARVRGELGRFLVFAGEYDRAAAQLEQALALAETLDLHETLAQVLSSTAVLHNRRGRSREAVPLLERALAIAVRHEHSATALRCYNNLQYVLGGLDDLAAARKVIEEAIRYARRIGERRFESSFLSAGVECSLLTGDWDDTAELWREAVELATTPFARANLVDGAVLLCERGEIEAARAVLDDLADVRESEEAQALSTYASIEARVLRAEGRPKEALAAARRVFAERERIDPDSPPVRWAAMEAFEAATAIGDAAAASEAISFIEHSPGEFPRAQCERFRARLGLGDPEEQFREAERLLDGLGMRFYRAVTLLEHAEWLERATRAPEAEPLRAQARAVFEELKARPWVERAAVPVPATHA
jgi:tetratricopeptide (TPR) repeat protein